MNRWQLHVSAIALATVSGTTQAQTAAPRADAVIAAPRLDMVAVAALYRQAVLANALPALLARLDVAAQAGSPSTRTHALLVRAGLRWQDGALDGAAVDADRALAIAPDRDGWLLKARITDAQGRATAASDLYAKAAAATGDPGERRRLELRAAMIAARRDPATLIALGRAEAQPGRGRIAAVVALLGHPSDALALGAAQTQPGGRLAQQLQLSGWALAAGDALAARDHGWEAFMAAHEPNDRLYALAIVVEALRVRGDVAAAITFLDGKPASAELDQAKVDLLLEGGRGDEALALAARSTSPELRERRLAILDMVGRGAEGEAEYRRRIAADPADRRWYDGLAAAQMGRGDEAAATATYRGYLAAARGPDAAIGAARQMVALGLERPAIAAVDARLAEPAMAVPGRFFLFETQAEAGRTTEAQATLDDLQRRLPAGSAQLAEVADGYERIGRQDLALALLLRMEARGAAMGYDQRLHLADLVLTSARPEDALPRLRALWAGATLPARRNYLARRIVAVARKLGTLPALEAQLQARMTAGTITADEVDLLVEVQLAVGRGAMAEAAVTAYAARLGGSETARLQRLLPLQARLGDQAKVERTLRRLLAIDPEHSDDYLRRLILIVVRARGTAGTPEERARQIDELVARMRTGDTRAFAAGVYAAASLDERAIDSFRRAYAANPADGDNLLQLGNLLVRVRRAGEASAILQYAAEAATTDAAFEQAISGLLDVFGGGAGAGAGPDAARVGDVALQRAERLVLERMAGSGGDLRFYALLGELARARGEFELERRSYDAALAIAGAQRPTLLRQLIGLTSDNAASAGGNGPAIGNLDGKTVYGRRLLALRQAYPPDFYADIARSLLAKGDVPGAERAFALMDDQGGLVDLDTIRGQAYARTGHPAQALASYNRGLSRHRDNIDLTVRTAILRERAGQAAAAHELYWRGLTTLLMRQPERGGAIDEARALELRQFYATLVEGLLLTSMSGAADTDQVDRLLAEATRQAAGTGTLAERPRLDLIVDLIRRIAEYRADATLAARLDAMLAGPLAGDPAYLRARDLFRHATGLGSAQAQGTPDGTDWIDAGLRTQAVDTDNFDLRLALAVAARDTGEIARLVDIAAANEPAEGRTVSVEDRRRPSLFYTVVLDTMDRLPRDMFERQVLSRLLAAPFRTRILFDIFRTVPDSLTRLETIAGRPLLSSADLIRMTLQHSGDPLPNSRLSGYMRGTMAGYPERLLARLSLPERITLYEGLVDQARRSGSSSNLQGILLKSLLDGPLDTAQLARVAAAVTGDLDNVTGLQLIDVAPANRPILLAGADAAARQEPSFAAIPLFLRAWQAGDRTAAFAALAALEDARSRVAGDTASIRRVRDTRFAAEQQAAVDTFLRAPAPTHDAADRFYQAYVQPLLNGGGKAETLEASYRKLLAIDADNPVYVAGMLDVLWTRDDRAGFADLLSGYVARHPDDGEAATVLQLALHLLDQPAKAEAVARATGADAADPVWIVQLVNRAGLTRSGPYRPDFRALFSRVFTTYSQRTPQAAIVQEVARRGGGTASEAPDPFAALLRAPVVERPAALRQLWRESAGQASGEADAPPGRTALLAALPGNPDAPAEPALATALTASPAITDELDRYLAAMPVEDRVFQTRLYDVLATGLVGQQRAAPRLTASYATLGSDIGDHELTLLLVLADRTGSVLDDAQRTALTARLRHAPALSAWQRVLAARAFLAAGDRPAATEWLVAAAMQALYTSPVAAMNAGGSVTGTKEIVAELARWPDQAGARAAYDVMVARIGTPTGDPATSPDRLPPFPAPPAQATGPAGALR